MLLRSYKKVYKAVLSLSSLLFFVFCLLPLVLEFPIMGCKSKKKKCKKSCALKWKSCNGNCNWCEADAVKGGHDVNGECLFVGRAIFCGDLIPGKVIVSHGCCYVGYCGKERKNCEYEYLLKTSCAFSWVKAADGCVPHNAVEGGHTACGETLYVGRCHHNGAQIIGKVQPSQHGILIPFSGCEVKHCQYEVLTLPGACGDCCTKSESVC